MQHIKTLLWSLFMLVSIVFLPIAHANPVTFDKVEGETLPPCTLPAPTNLQRLFLSPTSVQHNWDPVPSAWGYLVTLTNNNTNSTQVLITTSTSSIFTVSPNQSYTLKVYPKCSSAPEDNSTNSAQESFSSGYIIIDLLAEFSSCSPSTLLGASQSPNFVFSYQNYSTLYILVTAADYSEHLVEFQRVTSTHFQFNKFANVPKTKLGGLSFSTPPSQIFVDDNKLVQTKNAQIVEHDNSGNDILLTSININTSNSTLVFSIQPQCKVRIYAGCSGFGEDPNNNVNDRGFEGATKLQIQPVNPFDTELKLLCSQTPDQPVSLQLFDLAGRSILNQAIQPDQVSGNQINIPVGDLAPGVYFLHVEIEPGNFVTQKVVKL